MRLLNRHEGAYEHSTWVRGVAPDFAWEGAEPRSGNVYRTFETSGLSRPRIETEIERCRPSSENLTIGSASKMTGVDVNRPLPIANAKVTRGECKRS